MTAAADGPRALALRLLTERRPHGFIEDRATAAGAGLDARDAGLLRQLALGVTRHRATLDAVLEAIGGRSRRGQDARIWSCLRLGAYQMTFLERVPDHAAIGETVALAPKRARAFVNAILRNVQRARDTRLAAHEPGPGARRTVPMPDGTRLTFTRDVFADPATRPDRWLAEAYSYPIWFTRRRLEALGLAGARRVCAAGNAPAPLMLRVNRLRAAPEDVAARLQADGAWVGTNGRLDWRGDPAALGAFADGWCVVQDPTAQEVAPLLAPQPGERVCDLAAAPGGKTLHCAELMANQGTITAVDPSAAGIRRLREGAERCGVTIVATQVADGRNVALPRAGFDGVLVDAPCSNTGVLRRRAEARWRAGPGGIRDLARLQRALLKRASTLVRPGGRVVYSVCSIEPEEGPWLAEAAAGFGLDLRRALVRYPSTHDGGYAALFVRVQRTGGI